MEIKRRRAERWKRGKEEKRNGKSLCERKEKKKENEMWKKRRKEGRENEGEGEREERRGRERRIENRESSTRNVPPSRDAFPIMKLGNNMTPIKGRLGKNTTPTSKGPQVGGSSVKTIKPRRFISRRSQLRTKKGRISEV